MYAHHVLFAEDRREIDEERFWFQDSMHWPEPLYPFDAVVVDSCVVGLSQANARLFAVPPSLGTDYRLLNGYIYLSPIEVTDRATLDRRAELFGARAGYYYEHWGELYDRWVRKVELAIAELEALAVPDLGEVEDEAIVKEGRGYGSSHTLLSAYARLLDGMDRVVQYHFELLNLGYAAYAALYGLCRQAFPDIGDETIGKLVTGVDLVLLRPDDELRRLARLAVELDVDDAVKAVSDEKELRAGLAGTEAGERWLDAFETAKHPWFCFSYGNGMASDHRSWIDDTTLPLATIGAYVRRLQAGEDLSRAYDVLLAERERITAEYRALLPEGARPGFDESLALARTVFPYVENHNFYIEHWYFTTFWNKVREFGALLARQGFLGEVDDVFHLRHDEVRAALDELRMSWSAGEVGPVRGPRHWPPIVARRKSIREGLRRWAAPAAVGRAPEAITDPVTVMLWGITTERIQEWLASPGHDGLSGIAGSPGVAEGPARVILHPDQLGQLEHGEILVAPSTSPSWTIVFNKAAGAVSDIGGVMSHAAVVAREYGLPAVVGTGTATKAIKTGDRIRVDGDAGAVTILD
jgi:pyruvate,water dikinase